MFKEKIFTVSEFNEYIDLLVSQEEVTVEGEISEVRVSQGKFLFATIKDKNAAVELFAIAPKISTLPILEPGLLVRVFGRPRLHQKSGRFRIWADYIIPSGEGGLLVAFEKLKEKLSKEGLFDVERKRPLPPFPEKIALITAKGSRAYSDFIKILTARMGGLKIYFYPVQVQGINAIPSIVKAFNFFNKGSDLDLLLLTRGGGSLEDLMAFNSEEVARAVFASKIPVVCGVGHEEDITLADMVADLKASTPSNAAELIVRDRRELLKEVNYYTKVLEGEINQLLDGNKALINRFVALLNTIVTHRRRQLSVIISNLFKIINFSLQQTSVKIQNQIKLLYTLDYNNILKRGFSITVGPEDKVIKSSKGINKFDRISTKLYKGKIESEVL